MKTPSPTKNVGPSPTRGTVSPERAKSRQKTKSPQRKTHSPGKNVKEANLRIADGGSPKSKVSRK